MHPDDQETWLADRVTPLNDRPPGPGRAVVLWVQRSQRSRANPALNLAITRAAERGGPVVAYFGLDERYPQATARTYQFVLEGLRDLAAGLQRRQVQLVVRHESPVEGVVRLAREVGAGLVITDESHLRFGSRQRRRAAELLAAQETALWAVDNDVIVPVRQLERERYAARAIRGPLGRLGERYLHPVPDPVAAHGPVEGVDGLDISNPEFVLATLKVDRSVGVSPVFRGGETAGRERLDLFVRERLERYHLDRSDAARVATSVISPYLHYGHLDPWTVALAVRAAPVPMEARHAFLEELLVRRELSYNFTHYNSRYDSLAGLPDWARQTLTEHESDPRPALYGEQELAEARTEDALWNAGQRELLLTGEMHNWVRMYWGKQIILWSQTPAEALARTIELNNRYALDGRDPVSFTNILWCFGKHDRPWPRRPVFGSVRSMTAAGARRKFDVDAYVARVDALQREVG